MPGLYDFLNIDFPINKKKDAIAIHSIGKKSKGGDLLRP